MRDLQLALYSKGKLDTYILMGVPFGGHWLFVFCIAKV